MKLDCNIFILLSINMLCDGLPLVVRLSHVLMMGDCLRSTHGDYRPIGEVFKNHNGATAVVL